MHSLWLYSISFLDLFATSLLVPFLTVHLRSLDTSHPLLGVIVSVYPMVQLVSSPAASYFWGRNRQKQTVVFSLLLCSFAYYSLASSSLVVIFCCRVVLGVMKHTQTFCKTVSVELNSSAKSSKALRLMNAAEALGFMLGPVVGAHFIEFHNGFQYICTITTLLFIINALIVYYFLPDQDNNFARTKSDSEVSQVVENLHTLKWNVFWDIFLLKGCLCVSLGLFYADYTLLVVEQLEASPRMIGYLNSFQGLISVLTGLISGKLTTVFYFKKSQYIKLIHCFLLLSCSLFCIGFVPDLFTFVVCLVPLSSSSTLLRVYTSEVLLERAECQNRASVIGAENTIASFAFLTSLILLEFNTKHFATSVSFISALFAFMALSLSVVLNLKNENKNLSVTDFNFNLIHSKTI